MAGYYRVRELLDGVWHLEDPRGVNVTLLVGEERALLVDTGFGLGDLPAAVREITSLPLTVVNTHGHADHVCGNFLFEKVLLSPRDWPMLQKFSRELREGIVAGTQELPAGFDRERYLAADFDNTEELADDAVFDLGGMSVHAVPLPSHSPGSMGFWVPERELFLTGDSAAPLIYLFFPESSSVSEHIRVLESIRDIPARWLLCSHAERLIPKAELERYIACARNTTLEGSTRHRDPLFPQFLGRMYTYEDEKQEGEYAFLIFSEDKL